MSNNIFQIQRILDRVVSINRTSIICFIFHFSNIPECQVTAIYLLNDWNSNRTQREHNKIQKRTYR